VQPRLSQPAIGFCLAEEKCVIEMMGNGILGADVVKVRLSLRYVRAILLNMVFVHAVSDVLNLLHTLLVSSQNLLCYLHLCLG
jgi:hypothetical protein